MRVSNPTFSKKYLRLHGGAVILETGLNRAIIQSSPSYTAVAPCCCRAKFQLKVIDYLRLAIGQLFEWSGKGRPIIARNFVIQNGPGC